MIFVSFNVNGIRTRFHQLEAVIERYQPELIGLQEIKVQDADFPEQEIRDMGYHIVYYGQKTHYGVALMSKSPLLDVELGFPANGEDQQRRLIQGTLPTSMGDIRVINGYFPQGESRDHAVKFPGKTAFYRDLITMMHDRYNSRDPILLMGDFNVAPVDEDIGIGDDNAKRWLKTGKCSFLPEEREWFQSLISWGMTDTYRMIYPNATDRYSWFDYRSRGFEREPRRGLRIDHILASDALKDHCKDAGIDDEIRGMERPSDHCPVWLNVS
ncbi:MAG: exodeoxyribonuclease III [Acidobacteria bacterium]|nr:exodeoxyribonuclease III [Acidobacteriota bacterium]